jgi:hypothetical protein
VLVTLTDDPAFNPANKGAWNVSQIIIRRSQQGILAIPVVDETPPAEPGTAYSFDVLLLLSGKTIHCGTQTGWRSSDAGHVGGQRGEWPLELDALAPDITEAEIRLVPNPEAAEPYPAIGRIWGQEVVFPHVRLRRMDLSEVRANPVTPPDNSRNVPPHAWQSTNPIEPPDFDAFFPDDAEGGLKLDSFWLAADKDSRTDEEILETVRSGLRRTTQHRTSILRWIGNRYIWNKAPQHPDAIEIMYHAAECRAPNADRYGTRHYAVYFGLSVTRPKPPAILKALAEIAMHVDDPNDLDRIAWGAASQREELLQYVEDYAASAEHAVREKATIVAAIVRGELKAFAWATERARPKTYITKPERD